jgi:predicted nucleic acid-binding protein
MAAKILDASAAAALLFGEPEAGAIVESIAGARLVAPVLFSFELANVCLLKMRRHPERRAELLEAFGLRRRLAVEELPVDHDAALSIADATGLTSYDASYLWLARQMGAELVTLDKQLAGAATAP